MRSSLKVASVAVVAVFGMLGLASCAGTTPTAEVPTPSASATQPGSISPGTVVVTAPAECDDVELSPGVSVNGAALAACVVGFSRAAGSGHEYLQSGDTSGEVDFVYADESQMSGTLTGPDGPTSFVLTPEESWVTINGAWVRGDVSSTDAGELVAGTVGTAYRAMADPSLAASMIAASPTWIVQTDQDLVTLPNGDEVHAWRVQSGAPFTTLGVEVQEMIVWLAPGHTVVGNQATVTVGGVQTTTLQQYTDWGVPVTIELPNAG